MLEEFKTIENYPNYSISTLGKLKNNKTQKILKTWGNIYEQCRIINNEGQKKCYIHRLMGLTFLENPHNLPEIDHIDRNKKNNILSNLRWVSKSENQLNSDMILKPSKNNKLGEHHITFSNNSKKYRITIKGKYYGEFTTLDEAKKNRDKIIIDIIKNV